MVFRNRVIVLLSIARDRPRREIQPPTRYNEENLVAYALAIAEETIKGGNLTHMLNLFYVLI